MFVRPLAYKPLKKPAYQVSRAYRLPLAPPLAFGSPLSQLFLGDKIYMRYRRLGPIALGLCALKIIVFAYRGASRGLGPSSKCNKANGAQQYYRQPIIGPPRSRADDSVLRANVCGLSRRQLWLSRIHRRLLSLSFGGT